jgi:hypothetical protein
MHVRLWRPLRRTPPVNARRAFAALRTRAQGEQVAHHAEGRLRRRGHRLMNKGNASANEIKGKLKATSA